jgi:hypothetical protein
MAQLPVLTLEAAGSGRRVVLSEIGRPTVLVCHGQDTAKAAIEVNTTVRQQYPDPAQVFIASIIDLRQFPAMFQGMVKPELEKAYHKAADNLPDGADPADFVVLLPDWNGETTDSLGAAGSTHTAVVLVADAQGQVVGVHQDSEPGQAALDMLAQTAG